MLKEYIIPKAALEFIPEVSWEPVGGDENSAKVSLNKDQVFRLRSGWFPVQEIQS